MPSGVSIAPLNAEIYMPYGLQRQAGKLFVLKVFTVIEGIWPSMMYVVDRGTSVGSSWPIPQLTFAGHSSYSVFLLDKYCAPPKAVTTK
jgi:hypothetical protein